MLKVSGKTWRLAGLVLIASCFLLDTASSKEFDVLIRGGTVYDGTGAEGKTVDLGIQKDRLTAIGDLSKDTAKREIDARGLAVAPGFINMLSWATTSLLADGRSQGDIRQGVTLEVFGEGVSMGPLNKRMKKDLQERQGDTLGSLPGNGPRANHGRCGSPNAGRPLSKARHCR